jgi:hypothetical protein
MGFYLNPGNRGFQQSVNSQIYVDKTGLIAYTNAVLDTQQRFVCVSRPRRFGKSMGADMLAAYYARGIDSHELFLPFEIAGDPTYEKHLNKYDVLFFNMQDFLSRAGDADTMLALLQDAVTNDLHEMYPSIVRDDDDSVTAMARVNSADGTTFVIIIDEWDCVLRERERDIQGQKLYLDFLRTLMKDKAYVTLAYMTGILPIRKLVSESALNMFDEFSMTGQGPLAHLTGFTQAEVNAICEEHELDREQMTAWYNGYRLESPEGTIEVYNPRAVVSAALRHKFDSYWTATRAWEGLCSYISMDYDGLRDKVTALLAGENLPIDTARFSGDTVTFDGADDVLTLLVHLGYLGYLGLPGDDPLTGEAFIPNKEIQREFLTAMKDGRWPEAMRAVSASRALLEATWALDAEAVARAVEDAHLESAHITYNSEAALSYTLSLAYYAARDYYTVVRELPAGKGFADLAFIPRKNHPEAPAMLIELKWDCSVQTALSQIRSRRYPDAFAEYKDNLLLVGISYDKDSRKHECVIER